MFHVKHTHARTHAHRTGAAGGGKTTPAPIKAAGGRAAG